MKAIFLGNEFLLRECARIFQSAGGRITGIVTTARPIEIWATEAGLPLLSLSGLASGQGEPFDYLFSVANLTVLPETVITRAHRMAINFHDGPLPQGADDLPGMAGLNVPAWAIIAGHRQHAVSWHQMTAKVDAGAVLKRGVFDILPTDTAFSLNARCLAAGVDSFAALIDDLAGDRITAVPQVSGSQWYARAKRPEALGGLDFTRPAAELCALVRGLDFGPYANPLSCAKLWDGQRLIAVGRLETGLVTAQPAGTILGVDPAGIRVACADAEVRLSGLTDMTGAAIDPAAFTAGQRLTTLPPIAAGDLQAIGQAEPDWQQVLGAAVPAIPPYPVALRDRKAGAAADLSLPVQDADVVTAGYLAWICGLTGQDRATVALGGPAVLQALSPLRPITLEVGPATTPAELTQAVRQARGAALARAPMAADLALRLPDASQRQTAMRALSVAIMAPGAAAQGLEPADLVVSVAARTLSSPSGQWDAPVLAAMAAGFSAYLARFHANPDQPLTSLPLTELPPAPQWHAVPDRTISDVIADQVRATPQALALEAGTVRLSYAALDQRTQTLARALAARGAGPGKVIGLCLERTEDLVIAMLAILQTGAAYLPLDPAYPAHRIAAMIADAEAWLIVASPAAARQQGLDPARTVFADATAGDTPADPMGRGDLAYLIYTSGSTGTPKGVMIPHRAVLNFFAAMDEVVPLPPRARLLAVTSVSFDISVLEILWTLARGATLVLQTEAAGTARRPDFSLFYFASESSGTGHHAYRLLLEGARFADANGFEAVWTPERHFHAFGGLYPNPAISSAAVAGITSRVKVRAGSTVVPLHHPLRVAEDWALVDNLSNGRAGIAIASGWQPNDFVLRPEAFAARKDRMLDGVETIRKLWRGEPVTFPGHDGKPVAVEIHPKPMQKDIPIWLTAAGNPETFEAAGRLGCGVLTHLLGQNLDEVEAKIKAYHLAWHKAGHPGRGHVVLMLHSFVGDTEAEVLAAARGPMKSYLRSAVDLVRRASWTFPTIVQRAEGAGMTPQEMFDKEPLSAEDLDQLLDHAFERYYRTSGLFGTPESAQEIVRRVAAIGVDELACLIDFGIDTDLVLRHLPQIKRVMDGLDGADGAGGIDRRVSVAEDILERGITHLQCTPSMAALLAADATGRAALGRLQVMMVGGEAFPPDLARAIRAAMPGVLLNMYGPTETTIWSAVARLDVVGDRVPLGPAVRNTVLSVHAPDGRELPDLAMGELWIGGAGLAQGYWRRPDLTQDRFVQTARGRCYRTGDLVRRRPGPTADGTLEFLGRIDNQVKLRGHRIELGEIETVLAAQPGIRDAIVKAEIFGAEGVGAEGVGADTRLVGYVTATGAAPDPAALRKALAAELPDIMVPATIVVLDRMPLTSNGKIDRKALTVPPVPDQIAADGGSSEPARDQTESTIAAIWCAALGLAQVSVTDSFFDLGGNSLLVVQVQRQMKERFQRDIAITDLFRFPTIRGIAHHLSDTAPDRPSAANRGAARAAARLARADAH